MAINQTLDSHQGRNRPAEPQAALLRDCWLVEVMPPTWAWAYGQLLTIGEPDRSFGHRIA